MGENDCQQQAGIYKPVINRNKCEGKADCVNVCPFDVFTIGTLAKEQRKDLRVIGKLKGMAHQWQQAFVSDDDLCQACGLCVIACPENAIKLQRI